MRLLILYLFLSALFSACSTLNESVQSKPISDSNSIPDTNFIYVKSHFYGFDDSYEVDEYRSNPYANLANSQLNHPQNIGVYPRYNNRQGLYFLKLSQWIAQEKKCYTGIQKKLSSTTHGPDNLKQLNRICPENIITQAPVCKDSCVAGHYRFDEGVISICDSILYVPEPIAVDMYGDPVYAPDEMDDFGNLIEQQKLDCFKMDYLIRSEGVQMIEKWSVNNHSFNKTPRSVALPMSQDNNWGPHFVLSNSGNAQQALFTDVVYPVIFLNRRTGTRTDISWQKEYYKNFIAQIIQAADHGDFEVFSIPREANDLRMVLHKAETGELIILNPKTWKDKDTSGSSFYNRTVSYIVYTDPDTVDVYGEPVHNPENVDAFGNPIAKTVHSTEPYPTEKIIGISFLEDWYYEPKTGAIKKAVKGFTFIWEDPIQSGSDDHYNNRPRYFFKTKD